MSASASAIQIVCVILGAVFMLLGVVTHAYIGGFLVGSLMFFAAALLGADHTTNTNVQSRRVFQVMAGVSALPFVVVSLFASVELFQSNQWAELVASLLRLGIFTLAAFAVTFGDHPFIQRQLKKLGLFTPTN